MCKPYALFVISYRVEKQRYCNDFDSEYVDSPALLENEHI